jgi:hypothetical protein
MVRSGAMRTTGRIVGYILLGLLVAVVVIFYITVFIRAARIPG